jgi:hypothetical protein
MNEPAPTTDRFVWQRNCCRLVRGRILNAGCREDPAKLQETFGLRVTNLDRQTFAGGLETPDYGHPIPVDVVHDLLEVPWPFADDTFDLVVLADVLEDLPPGTQGTVLAEARRVGRHLCVTAPEDGPERDAHHLTRLTRGTLKVLIRGAGWDPLSIVEVDYGFVPRGFLVWAQRAVAGDAAPEVRWHLGQGEP